MFNKRNEPEDARPGAEPVRQDDPPAPAPRAATREAGKVTATIGPTIRIKGDLSGDEDLLVQGTVEGNMDLPKHLVTIGKDGQVNATVNARMVEVDGKVEGDINGNEQVVLRRSGEVRGNIVAPRVTLEDGCRFKGSIDMDLDKNAGKVADLKPAAGGPDEGSKRLGGKA